MIRCKQQVHGWKIFALFLRNVKTAGNDSLTVLQHKRQWTPNSMTRKNEQKFCQRKQQAHSLSAAINCTGLSNLATKMQLIFSVQQLWIMAKMCQECCFLLATEEVGQSSFNPQTIVSDGLWVVHFDGQLPAIACGHEKEDYIAVVLTDLTSGNLLAVP